MKSFQKSAQVSLGAVALTALVNASAGRVLVFSQLRPMPVGLNVREPEAAAASTVGQPVGAVAQSPDRRAEVRAGPSGYPSVRSPERALRQSPAE